MNNPDPKRQMLEAPSFKCSCMSIYLGLTAETRNVKMDDGLQGGRCNAEKDNSVHDLRGKWKKQVGFHWWWWWGKYRRKKESKITGCLKMP